MSEERLAVLRMVADKKITAEQAATLLDAMGEEHPQQPAAPSDGQNSGHGGGKAHHNRHRWGRSSPPRQSGWEFTLQDFSRNLEEIVAGVTRNVGSGWFGKRSPFGTEEEFKGEATARQEYTLPEGSSLDIRCFGGNLAIRGVEGEHLRFPRGSEWGIDALRPRISIDTENRRVEVQVSGHSEEVEVPWRVINLTASVIGGNATVTDLAANSLLSVNGGNLTVDRLTGVLQASANGGNLVCSHVESNQVSLKVNGGNAVLQLGTLIEGVVDLKARGGNVQLRLSRDASFRVEALSKLGSIDTGVPGTRHSSVTESVFHAVYGDGGANVTLKALSGNIEIRTE